jgi:hypothetical protein
MMTQACYLSIHKKHLTSEELDAELAKHFGDEHMQRMPSRALAEKSPGALTEKSPASDDRASSHDGDARREADNASSRSGTHE